MPNKKVGKQKFVIVTGLSGAGMSSALKSLEDIGYEVLDNFPLTLIEQLLDKKSDKPIALGIDTRTRNFTVAKFKKAIKDHEAELLFITCKHSILQKRFTETRRKHPLAKDRPVSDGINKEYELLTPIREQADIIIDTTEFSIHDLRRTIESYFNKDQKQRLTVSVVSFGFKNGVPREADIVMDVRFLRNPHWDKKIKHLTGKNKKIGAYIEEDESYAPFIENFKNLIEPLLGRYNHEGKSYLTIAIGCTGGKHRSVFVTEKLAKWLKGLKIKTHIKHRDIPT